MIQILNSHTDRIMSIKLKLNDTNTIIMACSGCVQPNSKSFKCISVQHTCCMDIYIYLYLFCFFSSLWLIRNYFLSPFLLLSSFFSFILSLLPFCEMWSKIPSIWLDLLWGLANELKPHYIWCKAKINFKKKW